METRGGGLIHIWKENIMAVAVAAAGSMAGGAAAQAIMGKPKSSMTISGTTGVGVATITEKKGKSKKVTHVPQADISQSLDWFRTAANEQENFYRQGLQQYQGAMAQAKKEIDSGYQEAFKTLKPMSYNSTQAGNEMMRFMGLTPMSSSAGFYDDARLAGASAAQLKQISAAEKLTDPAERAAAKKEVMSTIQSLQKESTLGADLKALEARGLNLNGFEDVKGRTKGYGQGGNARYNEIYNAIAGETPGGVGPSNIVEVSRGADKRYEQERASLIENAGVAKAAEIERLTAADAARGALSDKMSALGSNFEQNYSATKDRGYTGAEVTSKLEATPGYKFTVDQGTKAIERQGAAKGMLGSGNTLVGLTQFGQENAQNYFGMHMNTLSNIAQLGSGATNQLSGLQMQQGRDQSQVSQALGSGQMSAYGAIGDARANSLYQQGNLYADTAKFNTGLIQGTLESAKDREAAAANQQTASGPGQQNANLAQQQFNYGVFQNQQGGQAFAANQKTNQYGMKV